MKFKDSMPWTLCACCHAFRRNGGKISGHSDHPLQHKGDNEKLGVHLVSAKYQLGWSNNRVHQQ